MTMRDILKEKGSEVLTVDVDTGIPEVARIMMDKNIGALLVEDDGKLCGIVTERDVVRILGRTGCDLDGVRVADIMVKSENLLVAEADDQNDYVMAVMVQKNFRHMPIVDEGEIVGLISIRDVVRAHVKKLQAQVHFLTEYVR
ncbi:MAG: CBS domain-containing protein [Nitrospirota bacterium]|nr:CBS domain-containing protein [Nitrospirota bacterium]